MTKRKKRLERIRQNPKNVSFEELRRVVESFGFTLNRVKGSHYIFDVQLEEQVESLVIPFKKPHVKPVYVKRCLEIIDLIIALHEMDESEDDDE